METIKTVREQATIFHITHWKAGSQWIHKILIDLIPERIVPPELNEEQFLKNQIICGGVYPTLYVTKEQFYNATLPRNYKKFLIIRDLRDTLISGYFSIRFSHKVIDYRLSNWRRRLNAMPIESGLLMLMDEWLPMSAEIQKSWISYGEKYIRYEDLLKNDYEILKVILIQECELPVTTERLKKVILQNRFVAMTGGRNPGVENIFEHNRKGVYGDWKNHFTPVLVQKFNDMFGDLLILTGYEKIQ